ncbi:MAG TPA: 2-phosphosulfolactate phosphatase [Verrucomicrobia bacterium]|nr:2-phosphosulfolactate phosphatase [Verrucomicrobiota bacterium]HOB31269.1 2-phosphosulfolactate phosphatase [Verrucomicrobiota bacterium]HOP96496.1 2-phosphosulfolactate phosphatase [Verrucomicrobiota bacterium]HPU56230.1 2-phosphosulfolactate phosphatase [Verrucomicrobiota bacterium]
MTIEVLFTPADFGALKARALEGTCAVVFDVFRATTSMVTALANGATAVVPVVDIPDALVLHRSNPAVLLAGERQGVRIRASVSGGTDFHLGNSPREFTRDRVEGRTIVMTTTNGTRALRACAHADAVWVASFLNLRAVADAILRRRPGKLLVVCSGTFEEAALEDVLGAGALCSLLAGHANGGLSDSALIALDAYAAAEGDLLRAASRSRNGRRLLANPDLREDVAFCLQRDVFDFAAALDAEGVVRRVRIGED